MKGSVVHRLRTILPRLASRLYYSPPSLAAYHKAQLSQFTPVTSQDILFACSKALETKEVKVFQNPFPFICE